MSDSSKSGNLNRRDFLKTSTLGALGAGSIVTSPLNVLADTKRISTSSGGERNGNLENGSFKNWTGNVRANPAHIFRPRNLAELQEIVSNATNVRAVGSGHSVTRIVPTNDTLLNTSKLEGILDLDPLTGLVKVRAGTKLKEFSDALAKRGFALPSTGDTFYQSLAGLTSTGTHGTGMRWGSCSDEECLVGLEIVTASGDLLTLDGNDPAHQEMMKAARVSLGALGMVYSVTLKSVPVHNLEHHGTKMSIDEALDPRHLDENDHYEFMYFPMADLCYTYRRNITEKRALNKKFSRWWDEEVIENTIGPIALKAARGILKEKAVPGIMKSLINGYDDVHDIDRCDKIMTGPKRVPAYLMEFAIPIEKAQEAMATLKEVQDQMATLEDESKRFYVHLPAQLRFLRGDRGTYLSPGQGRDTCWFGVGSLPSFNNREDFFKIMDQKLRDMGGRPHWGKMFYQSPMDLYPEFNEYNRIRRQLDPTGKFENDFIKRVLGDERYEGCY